MKVRLLKFLNIPGLIFIALFALALQSTLFSNSTMAFFQPDIIVFLVLWMAMKRDFGEGGTLTLVFGYLVELKSAAPRGLFLTNYMFLFLITRFLYKNFQVVNQRALIMIGIAAAIFSQLDILFILYLLNKADNQWFHTLQLLAPTAIVHGALIPFVFRGLYKFDFITLKNPEAEHRYERDFYLDEEPV
jgi:cell shape-determining protein MreD